MLLSRSILFSLFVFVFIYIDAQEYPTINNEVVCDTYFDTIQICDEYRNLENIQSVSTLMWIEEQNKLTAKYLNKSNLRSNAHNTIDEYSYVRSKNRNKIGDHYYYFGIYGALSSAAVYKSNSLNQRGELLIDPNYISRTDKIDISQLTESGDFKYLAYAFNRNGSDWQEIKVVSTITGTNTKDHLKDIRYSNIAWKDDGFFYAKYPRGNTFDAAMGQELYYHKLNTSQEDDSLILKRNNPSITFDFKTTTGERFFILTEVIQEIDNINTYFVDYQSSHPVMRPLVRKFSEGLSIIDEVDGKFIAETNLNANNGYIVEIDPYNPTQWRTIIPEFSNATLLFARAFNDRVLAVYQSNQRPILVVYNYDGEELFSKQFPVGTSLSGFNGLPNDKEVTYSYSSYTIPSVGYVFNIENFASRVIVPTEVTYTYADIKYEELEFTASDGVKVPILLVYKEGLELDGKNPTILSAYGGFGAISTPGFDPGIVYHVRKGGVYAFANIRGGGDLGFDWRNAGRGLDKPRSIEDFIDAAEFLIGNKYTNAEQLGITGASNGGLVVAAAAIKRPDLFKVVVPEVAPLDMLRFEQFSVGHFHVDEYGSLRSFDGFNTLLSYSPLHNIKNNINYPTMLVVTSENDNRVPPFNSYRFVAKLQNSFSQINPVLLKVQANAGHYGSNTLYGTVKDIADMYGFIWDNIKESK